MYSQLLSATHIAHIILDRVIHEGDTVLDATCGNGNDTVFLAKKVGPRGHVVALDIQKAAIIETEEKLRRNNLLDRVTLIQSDHSSSEVIKENTFKAIMFNLGYLPGGDHSVTTTKETTEMALITAVSSLLSGGVLTIVSYSGHISGLDEQGAVAQWASKLDRTNHAYMVTEFPKINTNPPLLFVIEKR